MRVQHRVCNEKLICMCCLLNVNCWFVLQEIRVEKLLAVLQRRETDKGQQTTKGVGVPIDSQSKSSQYLRSDLVMYTPNSSSLG